MLHRRHVTASGQATRRRNNGTRGRRGTNAVRKARSADGVSKTGRHVRRARWGIWKAQVIGGCLTRERKALSFLLNLPHYACRGISCGAMQELCRSFFPGERNESCAWHRRGSAVVEQVSRRLLRRPFLRMHSVTGRTGCVRVTQRTGCGASGRHRGSRWAAAHKLHKLSA